MCDTLASVTGLTPWFAKNSDRPIGEAQLIEAYPARVSGATVATTHLEIADEGARAVVGSRPQWCWGLEHGINDAGVAIGNERLWTVDKPSSAPGLIGMDLVRLGLERAASAQAAVEVIVELAGRHGQSGSCAGSKDDPYWSSFLVADRYAVWVLETSGPSWTAIRSDRAAISNRLTIGAEHDRASPDVVGEVFSDRNTDLGPAVSDRRLAATRAAVERDGIDARRLAATLRDHGAGPWGAPGPESRSVSRSDAVPTSMGDDFSGVTVCQHVPGVAVTAASMIVDLTADTTVIRACVGSPCASVYVPFSFDVVPDTLGREATWRRFDALRQRAESSVADLAAIRGELAPVESTWWDDADHGSAPDAGTVDRALDDLLTSLGV